MAACFQITNPRQRSPALSTGTSLAIVCWLALLASPGYSAEERALTISGNDRTHTEYVEKLTRDCLKNAAFPDQPGYLDGYLQQCLLNTKLFSEVLVLSSPTTLKVFVKERWTLIPIPYLQFDSGNSRKVGVIVAETNFLGMGKILAAGGFLSNLGASYFGYLQNPSILFSDWRSEVLVDHVDEQLQLSHRRAIVDGFTESAKGALAGVGHRWNNIIVNAHLGYRKRDYTQFQGYEPPRSQEFGYGNMIAEYSNKDFHFYGNQGISLKLNFTDQFHRNDQLSTAANADFVVSFERLVIDEHALQIQALGGGVRGGGREDAYRLGSTKGFRGIEPHSAWADHYQAVAVDYQIPIEFFTAGTWTIGPFNDAGVIRSRGDDGYTTRYESYGVATYFFLTAIALPGVGIEFGFNNEYQGAFANVTVGLSL